MSTAINEITLSEKEADLLNHLVDKTENGSYDYVCQSDESVIALSQYGLIEINNGMPHESLPNNYAARASQEGINLMNTTVTPEAPQTSTGFEIESNVPVPKQTRTGGSSKYPVDKLEIGQSFHVPFTSEDDAERGKIQKRMATLVSNANLRYRVDKVPQEMKTVKRRRKNEAGEIEEVELQVPVTIQNRRFTSRVVGSDDPKGAGVRFFRVELKESDRQ